MVYTKDKVADAAASARPYVERALRDKELRENVRNAYSSVRAVYDELSSRRKVSDAASQLAGDKDLQDEIRSAIDEIRNAAGRVKDVKRGAPEPARTAKNSLLLMVGIFVSIIAAILIAIRGAVVLDRFQEPATVAFSTSAVRL